MKKIKMISIFMLCIITTAACNASSTGDKGDEYIYKVNEEIKIIDKESDGVLGTLEITKCEIVKNEPFTLKIETGIDRNEEMTYEDVTYNQIVLVEYIVSTTDSSKWITDANFDIISSQGEKGYYDSELNINYGGKNSVVFALREETDHIKIEFIYKLLQMQPTAIIEANL